MPNPLTRYTVTLILNNGATCPQPGYSQYLDKAKEKALKIAKRNPYHIAVEVWDTWTSTEVWRKVRNGLD